MKKKKKIYLENGREDKSSGVKSKIASYLFFINMHRGLYSVRNKKKKKRKKNN